MYSARPYASASAGQRAQANRIMNDLTPLLRYVTVTVTPLVEKL